MELRVSQKAPEVEQEEKERRMGVAEAPPVDLDQARAVGELEREGLVSGEMPSPRRRKTKGEACGREKNRQKIEMPGPPGPRSRRGDPRCRSRCPSDRAHSGDEGGAALPASPGAGREDLVDRLEGGVELAVVGVEVGRHPDADAGAVVHDDVAGVQLPRDF